MDAVRASFTQSEGIKGATLLVFSHRVNTAGQLALLSPKYGIEVDVRDYDGRLRLAHDPFTSGEDLDEFLAGYRHAGLIFNTKCDGLEKDILLLAQKHSIRNFWFLDTTLPTLVRLAREGIRQTAVRFSEYEPIEATLRFAGLADWVWVDCFTRLPLDPPTWNELKRHFKICLVSPELQSHGRAAITAYRNLLKSMPMDGVCTDYPEDWTKSEPDALTSEAA